MPGRPAERTVPDSTRCYCSVDCRSATIARKDADIALAQSGLDWIILRPSVLLDEAGRGTIALGPAQIHGHIARQDVADTLAALLHEPRITQQILELNHGNTPISEAVETNVRTR